MTKRELSERIATLRREIEERQQKLNAYEIVMADMNPPLMTLDQHLEKAGLTGPPLQLSPLGSKEPVGSLSKTDAVRAIIKTLPQPFSLEDVEKNLGDNPSGIERNDLSFILYRLKNIKEITQESKGVSGRPSTYKINAA